MKNLLPNLQRICRLCLIKCDNLDPIDEVTKDGLNVLLPKINLFVSEEPVICINCAEKVKKCFNIKAKYLEAHSYIVSCISGKSNAKVDLKDVYLSKMENIIDIPEDHNICEFCVGLVKNSSGIYLDYEGGNMQLKMMLGICLPELDLSIIEKPIICGPCYESLEDCFRFVTNYSIVENRIKEYRESLNITNEKCVIDLTDVLQFTLGNILMSKEDDNTVDIIKEEKFCVDPENVDELVEDKKEIFMEMEDHQKFDNVLFSSKNILRCKEEDKKADIIKMEGNIYAQANDVAQKNENFIEMEDQKVLHNEEIEIKTDEQDFNRVDVEPGSNHTSIHKNSSHLPHHRKPLKTLRYGCDCCSYRTNYKWVLNKHSLIHKDPSEIMLYQCDFCSYQAKRKEYLKEHSLVHKNSSEIRMYKCDSCSYQTKYKYLITGRHSLIHKNSTEMTMFQCYFCSYQTKRKDDLKKHVLVHKDASETMMYKCDSCLYQTKTKWALKSHSLVHKDPSEIEMYQCDSCPYQTNRKGSLKKHMLVHKDTSETTMYQCNSCSHQTNRKDSLKLHSLVHKDPSKIIMYQCDSCSYQTKRKLSLKAHSLVHKNSSERKMYWCESCSFGTKYKICLQRHMLTHRKLSK